MRRLVSNPTVVFLRSLFTLRENPFMYLMLRREQRAPHQLARAAVTLAAFGGLTTLGLWLATRWADVLAAQSASLAPGAAAQALLSTVEFYWLMAVTSKRRYGIRAAELSQAGEQYRLIPLSGPELAGMRNSYALLYGLGCMSLLLPFHVMCAWGGGAPGLWYTIAVHLFLAFACIGVFERVGREGRVPQEVDRAALERRRRVGSSIAVVNLVSQFLIHGSRMRGALGLYLWVALYPYLVPGWLSQPRPFYRFVLPAAVPALLAALPYLSLMSRRVARSNNGRPETIRVAPWSLAGPGTVFGLVCVLGFSWPYVETGAVASWVLGAPAPDPALAAAATWVALLTLWGVLIGGPHALFISAVTWGPLPSHHSFVERPRGRRGLLWETAWAAEAAGSVYVPTLAFLIAALIGGLSLGPGLAEVGAALAVCAASLAGGCVINRVARHFAHQGSRRTVRVLWGLWTVACLLGVFAPAPFGRILASLYPPLAALSGAPGLIQWITRRIGLAAVDFPTPAVACLVQLCVAGAGLSLLGWLLRGADVTAAPKASPPVRDTATIYAQRPVHERYVTNPIAVRLLRSRNQPNVPAPMFILCASVSILAWAFWLSCVWLSRTTGAPSGSFVAAMADMPWAVAQIPLGIALILNLAAGASTYAALISERATGALAVTCLTPLSSRELLRGYLLAPVVGTIARISGAAIALPLIFIGTSAPLVLKIAGGVAVFATYAFLLSLFGGLLGGLPPAKAYGRTGFLSQFVWGLPVTLGWLLFAGGFVVLLDCGISASHGVPLSQRPWLWAALVLAPLLIWWNASQAKGRLMTLRQDMIAQAPEPELAALIAAGKRQ